MEQNQSPFEKLLTRKRNGELNAPTKKEPVIGSPDSLPWTQPLSKWSVVDIVMVVSVVVIIVVVIYISFTWKTPTPPENSGKIDIIASLNHPDNRLIAH